MACKENDFSNAQQIGSYGLVSRVEGAAPCSEIDNLPMRTAISILNIKSWFGRGDRVHGAVSTAQLAHLTLIHHQIGSPEVSVLTSYADQKRDTMLAQHWEAIVQINDDLVSETIRNQGERPPYTIGKRLSDLLEVLPTNTAARLLLSAANPDISQTIVQAARGDMMRTDNQPYAVEAAVLLPEETRHELFRAMAAMTPDTRGQQGLARKFHGLIATNWMNYNSPFCGTAAIYRNLEAEVGAQKILEVQGDLLKVGKIVRGE